MTCREMAPRGGTTKAHELTQMMSKERETGERGRGLDVYDQLDLGVAAAALPRPRDGLGVAAAASRGP